MRFGNRFRGTTPVSQWLSGSSGGLKSVQTGTVTIGNGAASNTATITAVVTANSILVFGGFTASGNVIPSESYSRITLTNATTVTATRNSVSTVSVVVAFTVIEFQSGVLRQSQFGTVDLSALTSNTATIASVTTTKACVFYLGYSTSAATSGDATQFQLPKVVLTNATTVTGTAGAAATMVAFQVAEWN